MNKIRDFFYDKSDVFVALLVVGAAVFIIFSRFEAIMDYPEQMVANQPARNNNVANNEQQDPPAPSNGYNPYENGYANGYTNGYANGYGSENGYANGYENGETEPNDSDEATGAFALYIASGQSMAIIARDIVSLGFFESEQEFLNMLEAHDAARRVRAGNFILPRNATREDVIRIITSNPTG
jgi:hypothetical protein